MAGHIVIAWDNAGLRTEHKVEGPREGLALAKSFRTLSFRTVKVADALGSTHHWSRSVGLIRNHWTARTVADTACN
jgi:hypothetical protein